MQYGTVRIFDFFFCLLLSVNPVLAGQGKYAKPGDRDRALRLELGCTEVHTPEYVRLLRGKPELYLCIKGGELAQRLFSYVEINGETAREYKTRYELGARFAPFESEDEATALAMAFTLAEPMSVVTLPEGMRQLVRRLRPAKVVRSGDGYRVYLFENGPQQGRCEVPGLYEIAVQVWRDGLSRQISRDKVYEKADGVNVCKD